MGAGMSPWTKPGPGRPAGSSNSSKGSVNDKISRVKCRECGRDVQLDTNRNGRLVGYDLVTLEVHPCSDP